MTKPINLTEVLEQMKITGSYFHFMEEYIAAFEASMALNKQSVEALSHIAGICQSDLATHFGDKCANKITKALTAAQAHGVKEQV